jgi:tetratricopeptide (TPR) repeat protein
MKRSLFVIVGLVFGPFAVSSLWAQSDAQFAKANQEYAQGNFKAAIEDYNAIVRSGQLSANLFYDLGNAYFRAGQFGRAILNYERALAVDRHHPESQANLQVTRDEAHAFEMQPSWFERYSNFASVNQYSIMAAVAFWVGIFCIAMMMFARRRRAGTLVLSILSLSIFVVAAFAVYRINGDSQGLAIIVGYKAEARLATADNAGSLLALPPGSEIKIVSTRGDWVYAALPNNLRGWIPASDAERVRQ